MANWTGLAGAAGLAAALEHIQGRRVKEAQLQKELTAGQGEWSPMQGGGGLGGFFDALLGHNRPGQIGFGGQRYQFQPYAQMTPEEATALGMTYQDERTVPGLDAPSLNVAAPGTQSGFGVPAAKLAGQTPGMTFRPADTEAYPFTPITAPPRTITEEKPLPSSLLPRLSPKEKLALFQDQLKARREEAKHKRELAMIQSFGTQGESTYQGGTTQPGGTVIPPEMLPEGVAPPAGAAQAPAAGTRPSVATGTGTPSTAATGAIPGVEKTSPQFHEKLSRIANNVGARLEDLQRVMSFETAGTFSPSQKNLGQKSSATGLLQFLRRTAKGLGTTPEALAAMTPEQQLDYVEKYLAPYKGKIGNLQDLYMAVLSPTSIGKSGNAVVFSKDKTPAEYTANAALDADKKGYVSVSDAVGAVMRRTGGTATAQAPAAVPATGQPDTSMQVAGPGAPAPRPVQPVVSPPPGQKAVTAPAPAPGQTGTGAAPTGTPAAATPMTPPAGTTPAVATTEAPPAQPPFRLSMPGYQQIQANNATVAKNEAAMRRLHAEQRQAYALAATTKNTQWATHATSLGGRIADLERNNTNLREQNTQTLSKEQDQWRTRGAEEQKNWRELQETRNKEARELQEKLAKEQRDRERELANQETDPARAAARDAATQEVKMPPDVAAARDDLVAQKQLPDKPWAEYTRTEKALVHQTHGQRKAEADMIEKMDVFDRTALYAIAKRDGTPIGRASEPQLKEAKRQGAIDRQQNAKDLEVAKAQGKMDGPIGESDAMKYIDPKTGQPADPLETPRQALASGKMLMDKPQQATIKNARTSLSYVNRLHVLYFGGEDPDGSLTGEVGKPFEGIYPAVERFHKENQSLPARARNSMALRTGILAGKPIAQWAQTADDFIAASLGHISRDMGGERGHFTDRDAERSRKFFANLGTRWWGESVFNPNFMTASNVARNQLRLITGVMSDRVRSALDLKPGDQLPWDTFGRIMPAGQTVPAPPRPPTPEAQVPAAARQTPQGTPAVPVTPAPQTPAPVAPVSVPAPQAPPAPTQESVPAPQAVPKKLDGPTAQRLLNDATKELFPGRASTSLTDEEVAQARARARRMWQEQGGQ